METSQANADMQLPVPQANLTREVNGPQPPAGTLLEKRTHHLNEQAARAQRELRQHILDQSKTRRAEVVGHYRQLSDAIGRAIHELRVEKTD